MDGKEHGKERMFTGHLGDNFFRNIYQGEFVEGMPGGEGFRRWVASGEAAISRWHGCGADEGVEHRLEG